MKRSFFSRLAPGFGAAALLISLLSPAHAQWRFVVVNGQFVHPLQVERMEREFCLSIPNGRYWYDASTGIWGHENDPRPRGRFVSHCGRSANNQANRGSLSGRGMLYSEHEIINGRP